MFYVLIETGFANLKNFSLVTVTAGVARRVNLIIAESTLAAAQNCFWHNKGDTCFHKILTAIDNEP